MSALRAFSWFSWLRPMGRWGHVPFSVLMSLTMLTAVAWFVTIYQAFSMSMPMGIAVRGGIATEGMAGMAMGGIASTGLSFWNGAVFVAVWTVMMAAMMLPTAAPMIFMFASAQARRGREVAVPTWIFMAGYILVWAGAGIAVYVLVQIGSELATSLAPAQRSKWAPIALGATVAGAGIYQFTPIKRICLRHCRSPLAFITQHWRDGRVGALAMGLKHGSYCFGCCWALFAVLVAAGVMSVAWMLLLTLIVLVEKMLPQARRAGAAIGIVLISLGIWVASGAGAMPWLMQPR